MPNFLKVKNKEFYTQHMPGLFLGRKEGQALVLEIGADTIIIDFVEFDVINSQNEKFIRIKIVAPKSVKILRSELLSFE